MIGQAKLIKLITEQIELNEFPRFSIITGAKGSGKKTLAFEIAKMLDKHKIYFVPDNKVETIRQMISDSYKIASPMVYIMSDADNMSANAKNALLKVTEEPPHNAVFIMTVTDMNTVLDTIKSRASVYYMQPYTVDEILSYVPAGYDETARADVISELCETPGDVEALYKCGIEELSTYVEKVVDNIADVSTANAFKIAEKLAFKDEEDGFPLELFLKAFKSVCANNLRKSVADNDVEGQMWYSAGIKIASKYLTQLTSITGINKKALFDIFILDIREEWK